jgi:predicted transcriptional regulator YheO
MKQAMIQQYSILIDFLGQTLGTDYEIVLHDLSDMSNSIVAIANGHVSGRKVGAPLTSLALSMLSEKRFLSRDFHVNYTGMTDDNKVLRSSTMYIKDAAGKPVGMLCINFDDNRYRELGEKLLRLCHPEQFLAKNAANGNGSVDFKETGHGEPEQFPNSMSSVMESVIKEAIQQDGVPVERLTKEERIRVVKLLDKQGIFLLRGAINCVAKALHSSPASIYRYLNQE